MSPNLFMDDPISAGINHMRSYWGRFLVLGILTIALGVVCIVYNAIATEASVLVLGFLLLIGGIVALAEAFWVRSWNGFFLFFLSAVLQGVTGYLLVRYPHAGTVGVTMLLASLLIVGGLFRTVGSGLLRFPSWLWAMLSGVIALTLGIIVLAKMPVASVFFLGLVVGVNFVLDGTAFLALASALHKIPKIVVHTPKAA
jgi:uncharacterized membrane protein HdeD (DUF308 family)